MEYDSLGKRDRNYINGKISQFTDAYIRQYKVWTPEQMLEAFVERLAEIVEKRSFNKHYEAGIEIWTSEVADEWLLSGKGQALSYERMNKKYEKDKPVAKANSPIVERVRFGYSWQESKFFDISFGLKDGYNFIDTENLKKYPFKPWTINHVEHELHKKYGISLPEIFRLLSVSPIEKAFYEYWLENYYSEKENSALIPEVCGFRAKLYYYEYDEKIYPSYREIPACASLPDVKPVNFRYDFFVSNSIRNKAVLIELDGHEFHKTKQQRIVDSIKRNEAAKLGLPVIVFTGTKLHENIESCFSSINDIIRK